MDIYSKVNEMLKQLAINYSILSNEYSDKLHKETQKSLVKLQRLEKKVLKKTPCESDLNNFEELYLKITGKQDKNEKGLLYFVKN